MHAELEARPTLAWLDDMQPVLVAVVADAQLEALAAPERGLGAYPAAAPVALAVDLERALPGICTQTGKTQRPLGPASRGSASTEAMAVDASRRSARSARRSASQRRVLTRTISIAKPPAWKWKASRTVTPGRTSTAFSA